MIYLSGAVRRELIGMRDFGLMLTFRSRDSEMHRECPFAVDNGCFLHPERYDDDAYLRWLDAHQRDGCLFVAAPDVLGDAAATLQRAAPMLRRIRALGFPAALVAQDGLDADALDWDALDAVFVGGSDEYKLSESAFALVQVANANGKHTHMGRVNTQRRIMAAAAGRYESVDGTCLAFGADVNLPVLSYAMERARAQRPLFGGQ